MACNITSIKTSSDGVWQGENPLHYAFPLLIIQTTLVLITSRILVFLIKPFRQPKVVAEIIGGIMLGPSALGRNKKFMRLIFPSWSNPILESAASMGLLFYLFLVGLELDLSSISRRGKRAFGIAVAGMSLPFLFGVGVTFLLRRIVDGEDRVGYSQYLLFMGVSLSITAFPVLARILAELKLLTTQVGETAMAAAAFNDVAAWILLALAVAVAGNGANGGHSNPLASIWVLLSGVAFVAFMLVIVRPVMNRVALQFSPGNNMLDEIHICLTLAGVMLAGFMTDFIGIHSIFGAFMFGLSIPKGEFAGRLIKRIEDFVAGLLLPLYFASSGLKTNISTIRGVEAWGVVALVISAACAGKIIGTFAVAVLCMIPVRESLTLGVLMNTKGLVELIVLNIGKEKKVLSDEMFAILVIMALFTTFMTTPIVIAIHRPPRGISSPAHRGLQQRESPLNENSQNELRIIACFHGSENSYSFINIIESTRSNKKSAMKLYVMKLVELTDRSSSIVTVRRVRKNGFPCICPFRRGGSPDQIAAAFEAYSQLGRVTVRHMTAISVLPSMHLDVCHVAEEKRVAMIILPFHKLWKGENGEEVEDLGCGWKDVNERVLKNAPCSVAVLVDRTRIQQSSGIANAPKRVCILFFGGPDSREALELGSRMVGHPAVRMTVVRYVERAEQPELEPPLDESAEKINSVCASPINSEREKELDEAAVSEFRRKWDGMAEYIEKVPSNLVEGVMAMGQSNQYELIIVGKARHPPTVLAELRGHKSQHAELGPMGDLLASPHQGIFSSVLIIQQHDLAHEDMAPVSKIVRSKEDSITANESSV